MALFEIYLLFFIQHGRYGDIDPVFHLRYHAERKINAPIKDNMIVDSYKYSGLSSLSYANMRQFFVVSTKKKKTSRQIFMNHVQFNLVFD